MNNHSGSIALFLVLAHISLPAWADEDKGQYIKTTFMEHIGEVPSMAWMLEPNVIITNKKMENVTLYTRSGSIETARYIRSYSDAEIDHIRKRSCIALEPGKFYQYQLEKDGEGIPSDQDRAFYTKASFAGETKAGYSYVQLEDNVLTRVVGLREFKERPFLHNHVAIQTTGSKYVYSFHGLYDPQTKELYRKGLVLQALDGRVLAKRFWDESWDTVCDGCPLPLYSDSMVSFFYLVNSFHIPQFTYPLLLLDTSTVEGRALSFVAFSPEGKYSEYRDYEYVAGCIMSREMER
ncbi:MAG: hypothetical protein ACE5NW_13795 [Acidiferrobacterales bacterium]